MKWSDKVDEIKVGQGWRRWGRTELVKIMKLIAVGYARPTVKSSALADNQPTRIFNMYLEVWRSERTPRLLDSLG